MERIYGVCDYKSKLNNQQYGAPNARQEIEKSRLQFANHRYQSVDLYSQLADLKNWIH